MYPIIAAVEWIASQTRSDRSGSHADRGCRTQLIGEVRGDIGKLFVQWNAFGWHRVTLYGDVKEPLTEFAKTLGLEVVEEA